MLETTVSMQSTNRLRILESYLHHEKKSPVENSQQHLFKSFNKKKYRGIEEILNSCILTSKTIVVLYIIGQKADRNILLVENVARSFRSFFCLRACTSMSVQNY